MGEEGSASAKALGLQRFWRLEKAREFTLAGRGGGFIYDGKSVRYSVEKSGPGQIRQAE